MRRLKTRAQFLRVARGKRAGRAAFGLQSAPGSEAEPAIGYTVTKKTGNAPQRNRIKRRLRAAVRTCDDAFAPQHDYVLVGRRAALNQPFSTLVGELSQLLHRLNAHPADGRRTAGTAQ